MQPLYVLSHCLLVYALSSASETLTSDPRLRDEDPRVRGNPKNFLEARRATYVQEERVKTSHGIR